MPTATPPKSQLASPTAGPRAGPKAGPRAGLSPTLTPYVFAFFMAGIMAFIMCWIIVAANSGIDGGLPRRVLAAYAIAMPAAFVSVLLVRPIALRLTGLVIRRAG
ncbi:uncharacterized protein DUF2798 [Rhizobium sp. PP-F2F-G48]|nr:uncharacterized protein DUF2798 [Rhizobium sp. PP-F2F-G48]